MTKIWLSTAAVFALIHAPAAAQPGPAGPSDPTTPHLLSAGIERLCAGFLEAPAAAPTSIEAVAAEAGFTPGAEGKYVPIGQPIPGAPPAMSFHADAQSAGGPAVEMFLTTVPAACQVRVMGDAEAWAAFEAQVKRQGAALVTTAPVTPETTYSHEVYVGGATGLPQGYTIFVSRWVGQGLPKTGVWTFINVLPDTGVGS